MPRNRISLRQCGQTNRLCITRCRRSWKVVRHSGQRTRTRWLSISWTRGLVMASPGGAAVAASRFQACAKRVADELPRQGGVSPSAPGLYDRPMGRITAEIGTVPGAPPANIPEWSVSELSAALKRTVEDAYGYVRVRGEVSGFRGASPSGHVYFRLKDDKAVLDAVIWKMTFGRLRVKPQEGLDVVVTGRLTTFAGSSKYQIIIDTLDPAGIGALMALLEERKKKLAAEGLFDEARKQLLPFLPEVIGVVTSPTGAVIRDILHRLQDRFPRRVLVWPVRVQGETSAAEVAAAIEGFNALPQHGAVSRPDLIIVARGGGSLEDLWSFNEEIVVRAAAASLIPLISAIGHETDVTLIDFAADRRAPTPTAAAEMAVPVRAELLTRLASLSARKLACWQRGIE